MNYYDEIREKLIESEIYNRSKDYAKDRNKVKVYFEIGELLSNAGKEYGKNIIKQYSEKLMTEVGKIYTERNLRYMRKFYEIFSIIKWNPLGSTLTWSHYREILVVKNYEAIKYYIKLCENNNLTKRQLHEKIKNKEYDRLSNDAKYKIIENKKIDIIDLIPNPIIVKNNTIDEKITEYALKQLVLNNIDNFLMQLGTGFAYVGNEYKIKLGNVYNYIDILLFNYKYNCFVVVELKVTELKKEHIGQIEIYMNYIDNNIKTIYQDKTIGIIIAKYNNEYVIRYRSDKRIISRTYELM